MEPNLRKDDTILVLKHISPVPGDIVLLDSPREPGRVLIKRITASEGDTVEIKDKVFYLNNKKTGFRWKTGSSDRRVLPMNFTFRDNMPLVKLGRNEFFILSDNLDQGYDSRTLGIIRKDLIIGKMIYKY